MLQPTKVHHSFSSIPKLSLKEYSYTIMIRINGHLDKLNFKKISDLELFNFYQDTVDVSKEVCPHCRAVGCFNDAPSYERHLITIEKDARVDYTISVRRVVCSSCMVSHALLPDNLIPYGSYSIKFVLFILNSYLSRTTAVATFCETWQISTSTLYTWIHTFMNHYELLYGILNRLQWISYEALSKISLDSFLTRKFFESFLFSFLQLRKTTTSVNVISDS